ncbi:MAG: hypothetical protein V3T70_06220, partial [Phycisphaerae bacterium]
MARTPGGKKHRGRAAGRDVDARAADRRASYDAGVVPWRRVELLAFLILFSAYAYFHQGGGWNQNSRFDQIRSITEAGELHINNYMAYAPARAADGSLRLTRVPLGDRTKIGRGKPPPNSLDLAYVDGRYYPNKPPGTTFLALPAYAMLCGVERAIGVDADSWRSVTVNAWLTTVLSVGLIGALGGIAFLRVSRRWFPQAPPRAHVAATLAFGLGTIIWPFATLLFDHVPVASFLLMSTALIAAARDADSARGAALRLAGAGVMAGLAVATNYAAVLIVVPLTAYAALIVRPWARAAYVVLGGLPPAVFLGWYHQACFGKALTIANNYQLEGFTSPEAKLLGVFDWPDAGAAVQLLFGDYRGLFVASPVLLLSIYGVWRMLVHDRRRIEAG